MTGKTLEEFKALHDPRFEGESPVPIFDWQPSADVKRFIVTSAQNATPVHDDFWAIMQYMGDVLEAQRAVVPYRYKNPTSSWRKSQENDDVWDRAVRAHLCSVDVKLNENLELLGDFKIQPTASSPLTGAEGLSHACSALIAHPKVHTRTIATPQSRMAKLLMTTGACTVPNYTNSRAGRIGEFHHDVSAVLVELDGKRFYARRLQYDAKSKSVTDWGVRYFADRHERAPDALGIITGDTHVDFVDPLVEQATWGPGGIAEVYRPRKRVWHDLLDAYSCNPHHRGNPFIALAKRWANKDVVRAEVERAIEYVRAHTPKGVESFVVSSNHDDMLTRWLLTHDWKSDPTNAEFYLETALAVARETKLTEIGTQYPSAFRVWFERAKVARARCLHNNESLMIGRDECGYHFDRGPKGARGSIRNMRRLGVRTIGGHSHSPGEDEGALQVGTSTRLNAEYLSGPNDWLQAHALVNWDMNRQLIVIVDGKARP